MARDAFLIVLGISVGTLSSLFGVLLAYWHITRRDGKKRVKTI